MSFKEKFLLGFLAVLLIVSLIFIPKWQLSYHDNTLPKNSKDYIELEDKLRTTLILVWGGLIVVLGLYLTYRRIKATEKQADVIADGQITEQFTKAIDHLGAVDKEGNKNLEIRLGGIYALERISRHSKKDHRTIMESCLLMFGKMLLMIKRGLSHIKKEISQIYLMTFKQFSSL